MAVFTYTYPVSGTTPPTAAQMQNASMIVGTLAMADADTQLVITHNMAVPQADQNALFPLITHEFNVSGSTYPQLVFNNPAASATPANSVTAGKSSSGGTGFTATVTMQRPHTLIR